MKEDNFVGQVLTFTLLCTSLYSTYVWPGMHNQPPTSKSALISLGGSLNLKFVCVFGCFRFDSTLSCFHEEI